MKSGVNTSRCETRVSEHNGTSDESTNTSEEERTSSKSDPVEPVESPEARDENVALNNTLFLGSVDATSVHNAKL